MIYLQLLLRFMYIGVLAFGGGYAVLPLIQQQCVSDSGWITMSEFADLVTLSQITPGPISINAATFVGTKVAGVPGALVATGGFILPTFAIVTALWLVYKKYRTIVVMQGVLSGLKPAVVALIASAGLAIIVMALWGDAPVSLQGTDWISAVLMLAGFIVLRLWKPDPLVIIIASGVLGLLAELAKKIVF